MLPGTTDLCTLAPRRTLCRMELRPNVIARAQAIVPYQNPTEENELPSQAVPTRGIQPKADARIKSDVPEASSPATTRAQAISSPEPTDQGETIRGQMIQPRASMDRVASTHRKTFRLFDINFTILDASQAATMIAGWSEEAKRTGVARHVHLVNAYTVAEARRNSELSDVLAEPSAINLVDGTPLAWAARLLCGVAPHRIVARGPGLFRAAISMDGLSHYLLGGSPETLARLSTPGRIGTGRPGVVGTCSPPFRQHTPIDRAEWGRRIRTSGADVAWIGLGTPRQDFEAAHIARLVPIIVVAVGAAFDFVAGTKREAPRWLHGSGLEWVFRLGVEPKRLWRRYAFGNLTFLKAVLTERRRLRRQRFRSRPKVNEKLRNATR